MENKTRKYVIDEKFHRYGMWEPDDTYRMLQRAERAKERGEEPNGIPILVEFEDGNRKYIGK